MTAEERDHLTQAERATWKAKYEDLSSRRKELHGAVTYAFDGVFSWSMYGSTDSVDQYGTPYTGETLSLSHSRTHSLSLSLSLTD